MKKIVVNGKEIEFVPGDLKCSYYSEYTLKKLGSHLANAEGEEYPMFPTGSGYPTVELARQVGQDILELYDRLEKLEKMVSLLHTQHHIDS